MSEHKRLVALAMVAVSLACGPVAPTEGELGQVPQALQDGSVDRDDRAVVGIVARRAAGGQICSGVLIAPNVVLTARHCVAASFPEVVRCGQASIGSNVSVDALDVTTTLTTDNSAPDDGGAHHAVAEIHLVPGGDDACGFDLAALVLADLVEPAEAVPMSPRFEPPIADGDPYSAIGFGATCPISSGQERCYIESGTRRRVEGLRVQCAEGCSSTAVASTEWQGDRALCEGDSGGPSIDSSGRITGIGARGSSDDAGNCVNSVYVRVAAWRSFLIDVVQNAAASAHVSPPAWAILDDGGRDDDASSERLDDAVAEMADAHTSDAAPDGERSDVDTTARAANDASSSGCGCRASGAAGPASVAWLGWVVILLWRARTGSRLSARRPVAKKRKLLN